METTPEGFLYEVHAVPSIDPSICIVVFNPGVFQMSDVLQAAQKYHDRLYLEIRKVEDFLRLGEELTKGSTVETSTPLTSATPKTILPDRQARAVASEPRMEEPSRPTVDDAATTKAEASPASETNGRKSLFRGSFEPFGSERNMDVA
jgi:hypothetical protein